MDANYLLYRQQISLHNADQATNEDARQAHRDMAAGYAEKLQALHRRPAPVAQGEARR